ncbi:MAG: amidohydrolase family protein, partial [Clostridiales bacterium]|nr:amidohydrolase family protein [Clostridiales bacterium]
MKIFENGVFISCEEENRVFDTLVCHKGRIVYGGNGLPKEYARGKRHDLKGACVLPAFGDTHMHFESYATFMSTLDVRNARDFEDMSRMVKAYFMKNPKADFLPAFGCSAHTVAEKRLPEKADLDRMTNVPFMIVKYDGHAAVANSALLDIMPQEVKDEEGFDEKTGWMYQNAFYKGVNFITQKISPIKVLRSLINASDILARQGIALIHTAEGVGYKNDIDLDTIRFVSRGLPQAFRIFFQTTDVPKVTKRKLPRIGGCFKLALDGCFGSEDAALSKPYENNPENKGFLLYTQEEVNDFCIKANRENLQISLHAIGDVAVNQALTAFEAALADFPRDDHRHTIIHADLIPEKMQERAAAMGICIAVQPAFLDWEQEPEEYLENILGERAKNMLPLKSLVDK